MFGNNRFFAFCISYRGIDDILPEWELASGLAFLESKMAALKSIFLNNSRSKGNIMLNQVSVMHPCTHEDLEEFNPRARSCAQHWAGVV